LADARRIRDEVYEGRFEATKKDAGAKDGAAVDVEGAVEVYMHSFFEVVEVAE